MSSENPTTRDRILKACWTLLETGGAKPVRMSDIARAAKISRQALYLHFPTRAELLTATARHLDEVHDVNARLRPSRDARDGKDRLAAWVDAWGNYIPLIYGVARALMDMETSDEDARTAWADRMHAMRDGCAAAVAALERSGDLTPSLAPAAATDLLWTLLSVRNWEQLRQGCGWSQETYITGMQAAAERMLTGGPQPSGGQSIA